MARLEPFAGTRYDPSRVALGDVVAPPYDVVDERQRAELVSRSPFNSILVELPEPDEAGGLDRYANAARLFDSWLAEGVIAEDPARRFYVYRMGFVDETGMRRSTTGVVGALALDAEGRGDVLPHEQTMPKPKGDRLDLLRATRSNLSPIWGLSLSPGLAQACEKAVVASEPARAEVDGVTHETWAVEDPELVGLIRSLVAESPVLIADGHHRYETACAYQAEMQAQDGGAGDGAANHDFVMAFVVELAEDELFVQPIHRLVSGLPAGYDPSLALAEHFELQPGPEAPDALARAMVEQGAIGMIVPEGAWLLVPLPATEAELSEALDSIRLDVGLASLPPHELVYQDGTNAAAAAVTTGRAQAAFLLRPATVAQIAATAHGGRRMPPKTTFFQPKPRTGMVFRRLAG